MKKIKLLMVFTVLFVAAGTAFAVAPTDFVSADTKYEDSDGDGTVDRLVTVINGGEALTSCDVSDAEIPTDWTYTGGNIGGSLAATGHSCVLATATVTLQIVGANANTTGHEEPLPADPPMIAYDNDDADDSIANASGVLGTVAPLNALDNAKPVYVSAEAVDNTTIEVEFSENMSDDPSYLPDPAGFTVPGATVTAAVVDAGDDHFIDLTVDPLNDTGFFTDQLAIAVDAAYDYDENGTAAASSLYVWDLQEPEYLDAFTDDADGNGKIDTIEILFSESMDVTYTNVAGLSLSGGYVIPAGNGVWDDDLTTNDLFIVTITENAGTCDASDQSGCDTDATPDISFASATGNLYDTGGVWSVGVELQDFGPETVLDEASPAFISAEATSDTNIAVLFSENISDDPGPPTDYNPDPAGFTATGMTVTAATTRVADDNYVDLTVDSLGDTGFSPTDFAIAADAAYDYEEVGTNPQSGLTITDGQAPTIISQEYRANTVVSPYSSVDRFRLEFSEDVTFVGDYPDYLSDFTVTANDLTGFSGSPTTISPDTDNAIYILASGTTSLTGVSGGTEPTVTYVNDGVNYFQDAVGYQLASFADLSLTDGAKVVLDEVTPITTPTSDNTPDIVVSATEGGTIGFTGGCDTASTIAGPGTNITLTLDSDGGGTALSDGSYDCVLDVTDSAGNTAGTPANLNAPLSFSTFFVDTTDPVITSSATATVDENQTDAIDVDATDADPDLDYQLDGGVDVALFSIDSATGELTFDTAPDFENPTDSDTDNDYEVNVAVFDTIGNDSDTQNITITVTGVNEDPVITSDGGGATAAIDLDENETLVSFMTATDVDAGDTLSYSLTGGADQSKFDVDAVGGDLTFLTAPNFENPTDSDTNNIYVVEVTVTDDGTGNLTDMQEITVTILDVAESSGSSGKRSSSSKEYTCKNSTALNFSNTGIHKESLCEYPEPEEPTEEPEVEEPATPTPSKKGLSMRDVSDILLSLGFAKDENGDGVADILEDWVEEEENMCYAIPAGIYRLGSAGDGVKQIQQYLQDEGYLTGDVDGSFGPLTLAAVKAMQTAKGLVADGVVGPRTLAMMRRCN